MKELLNAVGGKTIDQVIEMFIERDKEIYAEYKDKIPYSLDDYMHLHLIDLVSNQTKLIKKLIKATLKSDIKNIEQFAKYYNKRIAEETKHTYTIPVTIKLPQLKKIELPKLKSV